MREYEVRNEAGDTLAILEVETEDRVDAELFAYRQIVGAARVVPLLESTEAADAKLCDAFQRLGLSESGAAIATEGRRRQGRVQRFRIGRQEATMPGIAPTRPVRMAAASPPGYYVGLGVGRLGEADANIDGELTGVFQRLGLSESAARVAARGRDSR